jgi:hypothetical protein
MFLSEMLPPEKVDRCVLIDKAWPMCGSEPKAHRMSWDHIYGTVPGNNASYFETWPIPLCTSKQDLKQKCNQRQLKKRLFDLAPGLVLIIAVHLCGTLSVRAVDLFNDSTAKMQFLALKP